eukprot:CFRG4316T1
MGKPAATVPPDSIPKPDVEGGSIRTSKRGSIQMDDLGKMKDDPGGKLLQATRAKKWDVVQILLDRGADVNEAHQHGDLKGMTALHWVAGDNEPKMVEMLLKRGAHIDTRDDWGQTPLHQACYAGNLEVVNILVSYGADVNDRDWTWGQNALHWATIKGRDETIKFLLEQGMNVNVMDEDKGMYPLHLAAISGSASSVALLLSHGGDPTALTFDKRLPEECTSKVDIASMIKASRMKAVGAQENASKKMNQLLLQGVDEWDANEVMQWLELVRLKEKVGSLFKPLGVDGPQLKQEGVMLLSADPDTAGLLQKLLMEAEFKHESIVKQLMGNHGDVMFVAWNMFFVLLSGPGGHKSKPNLMRLVQRALDVIILDYIPAQKKANGLHQLCPLL